MSLDCSYGSMLFSKLSSLFPRALVDDYYKKGVWDVECLRIDIELLECHREFAGLPPPSRLEGIVSPVVPLTRAPPWREERSTSVLVPVRSSIGSRYTASNKEAKRKHENEPSLPHKRRDMRGNQSEEDFDYASNDLTREEFSAKPSSASRSCPMSAAGVSQDDVVRFIEAWVECQIRLWGGGACKKPFEQWLLSTKLLRRNLEKCLGISSEVAADLLGMDLQEYMKGISERLDLQEITRKQARNTRCRWQATQPLADRIGERLANMVTNSRDARSQIEHIGARVVITFDRYGVQAGTVGRICDGGDARFKTWRLEDELRPGSGFLHGRGVRIPKRDEDKYWHILQEEDMYEQTQLEPQNSDAEGSDGSEDGVWRAT